jgi:hypothetical protein
MAALCNEVAGVTREHKTLNRTLFPLAVCDQFRDATKMILHPVSSGPA